MQKILGFIAVLIIVFGGFFMHGGTFQVIFKPSEYIIIFGSAICGLFMACTGATISLLINQIKMVMKKSTYDKVYFEQLLSLLFELINIAKKENIKVLDNHVENPDSSTIFNKYPLIVSDKQTYN